MNIYPLKKTSASRWDKNLDEKAWRENIDRTKNYVSDEYQAILSTIKEALEKIDRDIMWTLHSEGKINVRKWNEQGDIKPNDLPRPVVVDREYGFNETDLPDEQESNALLAYAQELEIKNEDLLEKLMNMHKMLMSLKIAIENTPNLSSGTKDMLRQLSPNYYGEIQPVENDIEE